jgi:hypothetical protein
MRVFHLTHAGYGVSSIALQRLKIARIAELNDPFELQAANFGSDEGLKMAMRAARNAINSHLGFLCFSRDWYSPVTWSHYADKHRGLCLGLELNDSLAIPINYVAERIPVSLQQFAVPQNVTELLLATKFEHWAYENEVRVRAQLDSATIEHSLYFRNFSEDLELREVILGALCELSLDRARELIARVKPGVHVLRARLADKFFKVVPDEETLERDYINPLDESRVHPKRRR